MASKHVDICEAVKDSLNSSTTMALDFVAERKYPGAVELKDVGAVEVFVFPVGHTWEYADRRITSIHLYAVQVIVRSLLQVVNNEYDQTQLDNLLELMEDIEDRVRDGGQMSGATIASGSNEPLFEPDKLDENLFYAGLVFDYRIGRSA